MVRNDFVKVFLLTAVCVAAFVGFFYIAIQCSLVGIYGTIFFAIYPKIKSVYQKKKEEKGNKAEP